MGRGRKAFLIGCGGARAFNPSNQKAEAGGSLETSLVYKVTAKAIKHRKRLETKQTNKRKKKHSGEGQKETPLTLKDPRESRMLRTQHYLILSVISMGWEVLGRQRLGLQWHHRHMHGSSQYTSSFIRNIPGNSHRKQENVNRQIIVKM